MIKCPKCQEVNKIQNFCGSCGERLLVDGVTIEHSNAGENKRKPRAKRKMKPWIKGLLVFLAIWIIGGVLLSVISIFSGSPIKQEFIGGLCFLIGIVVMIAIILNGSDEESMSDDSATDMHK